MNLCVLVNKIDENYLYTEDGLYLYYLPIDEYKKHILKGNICTYERGSASICYHYSKDVLCNKFEHGVEYISKDGWYSYMYASEVLNGRFEQGEVMISNDVWHG